MKILLSSLFLISATCFAHNPVAEHQFNCITIIPQNKYEVRRCENKEVICYVTVSKLGNEHWYAQSCIPKEKKDD